MERLGEFFHLVERVAALLFKACLCLYVVRCVVSFRIVSFDQFGHFLRVLVSVIFG
jgi:hypothetical protein